MNPNSFIVIRQHCRGNWFGYQQEADDRALHDGAHAGFTAITFTRAQAVERVGSMLVAPIHVGRGV